MSCHLFILKFHLTGILFHFFCVLTEMFGFLNQNYLLQLSLPYRLVFFKKSFFSLNEEIVTARQFILFEILKQYK